MPESAIAVRYITVDRSLIASAVSDPTVTDQGTPQEQESGVVHHPGRSISVQLFNGEVQTFQPVRVTENRPAIDISGGKTVPGPSVIAYVGQQGSSSSLTGSASLTLVADGSGGYSLSGSIIVGARAYHVDPEDGDTHRLIEIDAQAGSHPGDATIGPATPSPSGSTGAASPSSPGGSSVDVIVGYANGTTNPSSVIASVITDTNSSFANTAGMPEQVNLIGVFDATYYHQSGSGTIPACTDLTNLKLGLQGLSALLSARDTTRADLVGLMVPNNASGFSGCGDLPPAGGDPTKAFFVFSEADVAPALNHYAGSHEIGHNLGANHNPENCSPNCGVPYPYSYGHFVNAVASDIMTYDNLTNCPSYCNRVPQYSTPAAYFVGHPGYPAGIAGQRDNGASMLNLAPYVANYRVPVWRWYLRNSNTPGSPNVTVDYGTPDCIPVKGDWDGNGSDTLGEYCGGWWYLRNSNTPGPPDVTVNYGAAGYIPVVGDWDGNGSDTIGVISGSTWYLRNSNTPGSADLSFSYGSSYDQFVVGNWDGVGTDGIGVYEFGNWYLRQTPSAGAAQITVSYGTTGYIAVTGNWDALGGDSIGVVSGSTWYLRNSTTPGPPDITVSYGDPSYRFLPSDWDNNNSDTLGVVQHLP